MSALASDYSEWLTPERLAEEERLWAEVAIYKLYAAETFKLVRSLNLKALIEVGCGTGWLPTALPPTLEYTGVDANAECLRLAQQKTTQLFVQADVRNFYWPERPLVVSFAMLKHFALFEWAEILGKVLALGRNALFTMNVGASDEDDFQHGFPHTWVSDATLREAIRAAGHELVWATLLHTGETMVHTRRVA